MVGRLHAHQELFNDDKDLPYFYKSGAEEAERSLAAVGRLRHLQHRPRAPMPCVEVTASTEQKSIQASQM